MMNPQLRDALSELSRLLSESEDSNWASSSAVDVRAEVDALRVKEVLSRSDEEALRFLLAPTGSLQDISIDNGWGDKFCRLADAIERQLGAAPN
jgi:hypothetical protein